MDPRLHQVIEYDDVDELHRLIVEDQKFLYRVSEDPFPNTLLHIAAAAGKTQVAMEVAILKPEFARKLDPEGYSPIHLALQHKHYQTARALITLDPELIQVRGRRGITPLHYVAGKEGDNELELLAEFLSVCRSSIEDLTSRCDSAVHIAVKNHNLKAFKVLFGWLRRVHLTQILNWKDQDGNTVLHIAAFAGQTEIIKLLIGYTNVNVKNFQNRTALDIFQLNPHFDEAVARRLRPRSTSTLSLSQYFSKELSVFERNSNFFGIQDEATRNIILVVSSLIATATYQAVLSPPGGYWQDSSSNSPANSSVVTANSSGIAVEKPHQAGNIILSGSNLYLFVYLNSTAFLVSVWSISVSAISLWPRTSIVCSCLNFLILAYCSFLVIEFPKSEIFVGSILRDLLMISLYTMLWLPFFMWRSHIGVVNRVDATRRRIIKLLIGYTNVKAKNFQNRTALDIFQVNVHFDEDVAKRLRPRSTSTLSLSQFFSRAPSVFERYSYSLGIQDEATRNIILVVSSLIVTATYQAVLSPPGGYWQDSSSNSPANSSSVVIANSSGIAIEKPHQAGNLILSGSYLFLFVYLNSTAFFVSVVSFAVAAISLWPHTRIVYSSLLILSSAYCVFLVIEFPKSDVVMGTLLVEFYTMLLVATLLLPIPMWFKHIEVVSRVDATRRRVGSATS